MTPIGVQSQFSGLRFTSLDDLARLDGGDALLLLLVGVDLQAGMDAVAGCGRLEHVADGAGGETVAPDEHGDVRLGDDQPEADVVLIRFRDPELGLLGVLDELERDKLEKVPGLVGGLSHGGRVESGCRHVEQTPARRRYF